ncbi:MAG TPA: (S)-ureidoglycine aminohydrolase [Solirubrobacteraceae bacterium]|jgi:(S)-ureidoglycine aminohydrolase|nr:(S)-ureidoglycine aminohydrolase [Solirubrobacteraceae bacterium]
MLGMRGSRGRAFTLLTPENHFASRLPQLPGARVIKLVTPRLAPARLAQYLIELPAGSGSHPIAPGFEHFLFGLDGGARIVLGDGELGLGDGDYAYLPQSAGFELHAGPGGPTRLLWIKRRYEPAPGFAAPAAFGGHRSGVEPAPTPVAGLRRAELLPTLDPAFDFNITLMIFEPDVGLAQIEIHDEEHGLYMTAGAGLYHLDGDEHDVVADDFIYMAPYCPQGFRAGAAGAEYLLYKDVYRDGF